MSEPRYFEDVHEGMELPAMTKVVSTTQMFLYSAVTRNAHRIHYDQNYAHTERLPTILVHGPLQGAQLSAFVTAWMGAGGFLKKFAYSNRGMAFPGEPLTFKGRVVKKHHLDGRPAVDLEVWEENAKGERLAPATATVLLPSRGERA
ncbi:MAG: MaoC/PaaZ C-terminal domain-containing protein [Steroidobacteraceae bacterium]|jgi:hydroxyacyl-ACP dehydratase HTD2-like protein with hotdog domain|nr:MaoC/PaaZ C-terminal domain-containing protein [Steroidobacteraceae bacterium]